MNNDNTSDNGFFGVLSDISLKDYIQLICMKEMSKTIRVTQQEEKGLIVIRKGQVVHATLDSLQGREAIQRILSWKKGSFRNINLQDLPADNIEVDYRVLLLEAEGDNQRQPRKRPSPVSRRAIPDSSGDRIGAPGREQPPTPSADIPSRPHLRPRRFHLALLAATTAVCLALVTVFLQFSGFFDNVPEKVFAISGPPNTSADKPASPAQAPPQSQAISIGPLTSSEAPPKLPEETILRLHGSNTIGAQLAPALAEAYLATLPGAGKVEKVPGKVENEVFLKGKVGDKLLTVEIAAHGSSTAFKDLAAEVCDIGMSSRRIKAKEAEELQRFGNMTAPGNEHVIALDGIAVIVHKANPVNTLTMDEVAAIFSGKIGDWSQLGGNAGEIRLYARDENSGTYDTFKSLVLDKLELKAGAKRFESNPDLAGEVAADPQGIGFTSLPHIAKAKAVMVAEAGAKPILPTFFTVATEDYPIARRLYLYTAANSANPHVGNFIEFVQSQQGQEIAGKIDMVDMNIRSFQGEKADRAKAKNPALVDEYQRAIDNSQRLSLNFRFESGKVTLDNRGERDLGRVVDFLKDKLDRKVVLAGFADATGDYEINRKIAQMRADLVAEQLRARGIAVHQVFSGGQELPVASNQTPAGKERNRRVEVWLR
jgi:phosphate transport system substrate-binding protein